MPRLPALLLTVALLMPAIPAAAAPAATGPVVADPGASAHGPKWELRWNPSPRKDGLNAFEALEDDRRGSHPEGFPHVYPEGDAYRFDAHLVDRDGSDRMRNEVRGMRDSAGRPLEIRKDETWRLSYQMYLPDTLDATTAFTHIWQVKTSDTGTPVMQLTLPIKNGVPKIEARYWTLADNQVHPFATHDLAAIQNKWVTVTLEWKSSDDGYLRWAMHDGRTTLVDARADHIDLYWSEEQYNRPKWGIYRSIRSAGLQDTHMLIKDLKAWQLGPATPPVQLPEPDRSPGAYEAERAGNVFEGAAEPVYCRICSGGRKTILIGGNTYDYTVVRGILSETTATRQLTVHAVVNGAQSFRISVNGADSIEVPMTGTPDRITTTTVPVPLIAGVNTIRFFHLGARTPELDKIVIR
ncbi:hypothetical protein GCM10010404_45550 [Nonomuraea africana]|uniref:CBM6 domain-containing protein n=1 Tax=Nonomuraea africana TaxID=46171 RepID=A0ABR9KHL7_9ACTN|nr:heparin lyase I family protein [Nonomuraea africana]MBE1561503.1 hypothetical protein [Nonomuraea africana]